MRDLSLRHWQLTGTACLLALFASLHALLKAADGDPPHGDSFIVTGRTQCVPGRKGTISPAIARKVAEVLVSQGDTVKKGQALVQLHDRQIQADVHARKVKLENADTDLREARCNLVVLENSQGAVPENEVHEARMLLLTAVKLCEAAKAGLDLALAKLQQHVITAPIDGVVNRLAVNPGMISKPGEVWGEILDLQEIDVRIPVPIHHANSIKVGAEAEVLPLAGTKSYGKGKVIFVGLEPSREGGQTFALVRLVNPDGRLRCEIPAQVRLLPIQGNRVEVRP